MKKRAKASRVEEILFDSHFKETAYGESSFGLEFFHLLSSLVEPGTDTYHSAMKILFSLGVSPEHLVTTCVCRLIFLATTKGTDAWHASPAPLFLKGAAFMESFIVFC